MQARAGCIIGVCLHRPEGLAVIFTSAFAPVKPYLAHISTLFTRAGSACSQHLVQGRWARSENCVVVAEGELGHNGVFKVHALGFPPVEARAKSLAAAKARSTLKPRESVPDFNWKGISRRSRALVGHQIRGLTTGSVRRLYGCTLSYAVGPFEKGY